jgi:hypothetical protein
LSIATLEIEHTLDLGAGPGDLRAASCHRGRPLPIVHEITWRDPVSELAALLDERTTWAKQSMAGLVQRDASLAELRRLLEVEAIREREGRSQSDALKRDNDALRRELAELRKVNEQQSASVESLRTTIEDLRRTAADPRTNGDLAEQDYFQQLSQIRQIAAEACRPIPVWPSSARGTRNC